MQLASQEPMVNLRLALSIWLTSRFLLIRRSSLTTLLANLEEWQPVPDINTPLSLLKTWYPCKCSLCYRISLSFYLWAVISWQAVLALLKLYSCLQKFCWSLKYFQTQCSVHRKITESFTNGR